MRRVGFKVKSDLPSSARSLSSDRAFPGQSHPGEGYSLLPPALLHAQAVSQPCESDEQSFDDSCLCVFLKAQAYNESTVCST